MRTIAQFSAPKFVIVVLPFQIASDANPYLDLAPKTIDFECNFDILT